MAKHPLNRLICRMRPIRFAVSRSLIKCVYNMQKTLKNFVTTAPPLRGRFAAMAGCIVLEGLIFNATRMKFGQVYSNKVTAIMPLV